ncbi:MAG TPA: alkaline phosphatase family protein [Bryobacteraceae bacterium]|nr:alkaline phosphatase family protein [Bryobacteraceae bacterium]
MSRLLLIGWDAADWKVIDPLLAAGEMPHLARLIQAGVRGNIATIHPPLSPMLWTSIATGKRPPKHGIYGFSEPTPDGLSVRPISNLSRKTKAIWNILHQNGKSTLVVGWWPSNPAEPIRGAMVSDLFPLKGATPPGAPMPAGAVSPASLASRLADLRVHPTELGADVLRLFVPGWKQIDQTTDKTLHDLAGIVAETMSVHNAATELLETEPWDLAAIYYSAIDHFSHRFMRYHAHKRLRADDTDPALLAEVVRNGYRYHDVMLGRLMALAGSDCAVMLTSDHGFHSDRLLPDYIPAEAAGPAVEHRRFGIFCLKAPGVPAGGRVHGATVLDIAPTALHILGLPAGMDMDGKVLVNAFATPQQVRRIESWDAVEGDDGRHAAGEQYDGAAAAESLKQLVDLGYVAPPGEDARTAVEECVVEQRYNLARAHIDAGSPDLAAAILRELIAGSPEQARFYSTLAACLIQSGDRAGCRRLLDSFDRACAEFAPRAAAELKRRRAETPDKDVAAGRGQKSRREMYERRQLAEKATGFVMERLVLRCRLALGSARASRRKEAARALLLRLAQSRRQSPALRLFMAQGFTALKDYDRAFEFVRRVRRADPDNFEALALEARIHFQARRFEQAVDRAVESLSLVYFQPSLHYLLAAALQRLGEREKAEQAFRATLALAPEYPAALEALGRLILRDRNRVGEGSLYVARAAELRRLAKQRGETRRTPQDGETAWEPAPAEPAAPPRFDRSAVAAPEDRSQVVTIVAGLPRSGTSMMMQLLAAAGIAPYTDARRTPDEDNPRGYFEHEQAAGVHRDASWIPRARGKAVKIVAHLLPYLPEGEQYRLILMHRDLSEVVASQAAMLQRLGRPGGKLTGARLMRTYTQQLVRVQSWLRRRAEIPVLPAGYAEALEDPRQMAARLARFLGQPFDEQAAAKAIEPALRRQRAAHQG